MVLANLFTLSGLSLEENRFLSQYASVTHPDTIVIPYTDTHLKFIQKLKDLLPIKVRYPNTNSTANIKDIEYKYINDTILIQFIK